MPIIHSCDPALRVIEQFADNQARNSDSSHVAGCRPPQIVDFKIDAGPYLDAGKGLLEIGNGLIALPTTKDEPGIMRLRFQVAQKRECLHV